MPAPVFRLRMIGLRYYADTDNNRRTPPVAVGPSDREFRLIRSWLMRAFPVGEVDIAWRTVDASNQNLQWPFDSGEANTAIAAIRGQDVQAGTDDRTHYYGVVADAADVMVGGADTPTTADELEKLRGSPSVKFRVIATDGFHQTTLTSEALPAR